MASGLCHQSSEVDLEEVGEYKALAFVEAFQVVTLVVELPVPFPELVVPRELPFFANGPRRVGSTKTCFRCGSYAVVPVV